MKIKHHYYKDYPEQPYISPNRDLENWEHYPEKYPYAKVEKFNMIRLDEGILPGDLIMLWRVGLGTFTNESTIPDYFEYKYGINSTDSLNLLEDLGFIFKGAARDSLEVVNAPVLKRILKTKGLPVGGNKAELSDRVLDHFDEDSLSQLFEIRKYFITDMGREVVKKHDKIIQKHGPKM